MISHAHLDHLDLPSLVLLGTDTPLAVPRGAGRMLRRAGFRNVTELAGRPAHRIGDVRVQATPAAHSGFRPPFGPYADAARLSHRRRRRARLFRRRHGRLRRDGRVGGHRPGAAAGVGLGAAPGSGPYGSAPRRRGAHRAAAARRRAHPLGHAVATWAWAGSGRIGWKGRRSSSSATRPSSPRR